MAVNKIGVEYTHSRNLVFKELFGHAEDLIEGVLLLPFFRLMLTTFGE